MKKVMHPKSAPLLLSFALTASMLAACSGNDSGGGASPSASPSAAPAETPPPAGYNGKDNLQVSDKPLTLSLFYAFGANGAPKGDTPTWKKAADITNVTMKNVANESISDEQQSFNTMLAGGQLPDIIHSRRDTLNRVLGQGVLIPLDDLIEQHAPNIKQFLKDYPDARRAGSGPDGKLYTITGTLGGEPGKALPSRGFFIRQDWLDKLNLSVPKTLEEFKAAMYAFRDKDPNGNGKKDEVPYFYRDKGIATLLQLWGAYSGWYIGADDKVHHGRAEPSYRTAMKELAQWYKDGIIDPEIFTRGSQARQFLLGNNIGGSTIDWFASTAAVNDSVRDKVPGINFAAIAPPADINGKVKIDQSREAIHIFAWGISSAAKDPVAVIKYLDFFMSEAGERLMNYGIEGEHYDMVNGQPALKEVALKFPSGFPNFQRSIGAGYEIGKRGSLIGEVSSMNEIAKVGFEMYEKSNWLTPPFPLLSLTEAEKKAIDDVMLNLTPYMDEYEQKVLMGAQDVDATWDAHQAELGRMNLQKALDAYNSAYTRFKAETKK